VSIGNSVISIEREAFKGCSGLTSVTIPASVKSMDYAVFDGCSSLTSIYMVSHQPPSIDYDLFWGTPDNLIIYVPAGSKETYFADANWEGLPLEEYEVTGIKTLPTATEAVEVYTINGRKAGRFGSMEDARRQLPAGLYIVNRKKMRF